jgi:phospholipase/lecithinase/hemolysin
MKKIRSWGAVTLASLLLAACGGGGDGDQSPRVKYSAMVSFGDSLSDVGTYATPGLVAASGGGKYTVNGPTGKNWTELLAVQAGTGAPCAAQTGLEPSGALATAGFGQAITNHAGCYGYAQGGARVTNPIGPGNKALLQLGDASGAVGQLTVPVVTQINNHLTAVGGSFSGTELVTVMAGGNDVFINLATAGANPDPVAGGTAAVTAMGQAGAELAGYIKALVLAKGATHVVVVNLPDVSQTPLAYGQSAATQGLISQMVITFNAQLHAGLAGTSGVLEVDAYTQGRDQIARPQLYALTNVTTPACDLTKLAATLFASSLVCSANTLVAGDTSHYVFADTVHPTPFAYQLLAQFVAKRMVETGWL